MAVEAIFDTNLFVGAGFNPRSASARLIEAARDGRVRLIWCAATRDETRRVLTKIPRISWETVADIFATPGERPAADPTTADFVTDPEDRKFAALSLATGAPVITSDDDLLSHAGRIDAIKPGTFFASL